MTHVLLGSLVFLNSSSYLPLFICPSTFSPLFSIFSCFPSFSPQNCPCFLCHTSDNRRNSFLMSTTGLRSKQLTFSISSKNRCLSLHAFFSINFVLYTLTTSSFNSSLFFCFSHLLGICPVLIPYFFLFYTFSQKLISRKYFFIVLNGKIKDCLRDL